MLTNAVAPDKLGGLERYVRELSAELVRAGAGVRVLARAVDGHEAAAETGDDGVRIERYRLPPRSSLLFAPSVPIRAATAVHSSRKRSPSDVVHAHFPVPALPLALARAPYLYTFHAPVYRELLSERAGSYPLAPVLQPSAVRVLRAAERLVVRRATRLVVLSEYMRSELARLDPDAGARAVLIPGGVDTDRFSPGAGRRDAWSTEAEPLLFTARRLTPRTGVAELLRAMPAIRSSFPRARLAIAGVGRSEQALRDETRRRGLEGSVRFLGRISDADLVNCYRSCDLVVIPTQELEGYGLATAEALACGAAVVATRVGASPELLAGIDESLLVQTATPEAIAQTIIALLFDPDRLREIRARIGAAGDRGLGWPTVAARYRSEYTAVVDGAR